MQVFAYLTCLSIFVSDSQIYYKVIKEIEPGEELLVYVKEGGYSLGNMAPSMEGKASIHQTGPSAPLPAILAVPSAQPVLRLLRTCPCSRWQ